MIEFQCSGCQVKLKAKDSVSGKQIKCPKCSALIKIPTNSPPKPISPPATQKQKDYALSLGIQFQPDITKSEISKLLDMKVGNQIEERYKRLDDLTIRESKAYDKMKEEILADLDVDECRLSTANESQVMEKYEEQDFGAILIKFPIDDFDPEDFSKLGVDVSFTDNLSGEDMSKILFYLGIAAHENIEKTS